MADPKGKPKKPTTEAFKDVAIGEDGVYRVTAADAKTAGESPAAGASSGEASGAGAKSSTPPASTAAASGEAKPAAGSSSGAASSASGTSAAGAAKPAAASSSASSTTPSGLSSSSGSNGGSNGGSGGGFKTALTAGAALAAGALLAFWIGPRLTGAAATEKRVEELTQRVALFDGQANALNEAAGRVNALDSRVESMAGGLSALETSFAGLPQGGEEPGPRIAALTERLDGLEKALSELSTQQAAVVETVNASAGSAPANGEAAAAVESRLATVESRVEAISRTGGGRLDAIEARVAELGELESQTLTPEEFDARVAALAPEPSLPPEAASRLSALEARIESLTTEIAAAFANGANAEGGEPLAAAAPSAESLRAASDAAAALSGLQGLETRLGAFDGAALEADLGRIRARVEAAEAAAKAAAEAPPAVTAEELATLSARLDELDARQAAAAEAPTPITAADLEAFVPRDELADLPTRADLEALAPRDELADLATRAEFTALSARLDEAESRVAAAVSVRTEAASAVAAADLQSAATGSAPFLTQLTNLQRFSGVEADPALLIYARTGVPTLASLLNGFNEAERAALRAEEEARARTAEDVGGKLTGALSSLVSVRRTAESTGVDSASILARARARLGEGDLASALTELELLQAEPRAGMASWLQGAQARRNVEESLGRLRQNLLTAPGPQ